MPAGRSSTHRDLASVSGGAHGTFVYGNARSVVLRVAYAIARAGDSQPYWVDVRDPEDRVEIRGPVELGWVPNDHLFVLSPSEAKPQDAVSNLALWTIVRSDEPSSVIAGLSDFLRLPPALQEVLSRYGQENYRPVFVVANTDRVRNYYPRNVVGVRAIVDSMLHSGVTPIFAAVGAPGPGRNAFDSVFEVEAKDLAGWRKGNLVCERTFEGAPFQAGERLALSSVPEIVVALEGLKDPSTQTS
jgi:hypothetical protein